MADGRPTHFMAPGPHIACGTREGLLIYHSVNIDNVTCSRCLRTMEAKSARRAAMTPAASPLTPGGVVAI